MKSRAWYLVCAVPVIGGIVAAVVVLISMLAARVENMPRVVIPGEGSMQLEARSYLAFGESESRVGGTVYRNTSFTTECKLTAHDGTVIALEPPTATTSYSIGAYKGSSLYSFTIENAGTYHLACKGDAARPAVIAVGQGIMKIIAYAFGAFTAGLVGAALAFFLVRRMRRGQSTGSTS